MTGQGQSHESDLDVCDEGRGIVYPRWDTLLVGGQSL